MGEAEVPSPACRLWNSRLLAAFPSRWGCRTASFARLDLGRALEPCQQSLFILLAR